MSVSIKNMDMPKNCDECLFGDWSNLHQTAACKLLEYEPCFADFSREYESARSVKCPLVASTIELLAQPEQRWIPCDERMPEEDYWTGANFQYSADVLMTVYNAEDEETIIDYGCTRDGKWYSYTTDCFVPPRWKVIAWMSLPEPYER